MNKILHLVLKNSWYDKIASGEKTSEYRECKPYWNKKFIDCKYTHIIFHRGYTSHTMLCEIISIGITSQKNDLGLDKCWEIKLLKENQNDR